MKYEMKGGMFPVVTCCLEDGEQMFTEKGSMVWQTPNIKMETKGGGLGKMFSKAFSGENMFQNIFTAENGAGMITFGSSFPGKIIPLEIAPGKEMILQKRAFLAAESGVKLEIKQVAGFKNAVLGGEGLFHTILTGPGKVWLQTMPITSVADALRPLMPTGN